MNLFLNDSHYRLLRLWAPFPRPYCKIHITGTSAVKKIFEDDHRYVAKCAHPGEVAYLRLRAAKTSTPVWSNLDAVLLSFCETVFS